MAINKKLLAAKRARDNAKRGLSTPGTARKEAQTRRRVFIEAYLRNGGNGTQAAITAGFSKRTAYSAANKLLKEPKVAAAVRARAARVADLAEMTTENWAKEVRSIAFFKPGDLLRSDGSLVPINELPEHVQAAIASVEGIRVGDGPLMTTKIKSWDKNAALVTMGKHLGLFEKDNRQQGENLKLVVEFV